MRYFLSLLLICAGVTAFKHAAAQTPAHPTHVFIITTDGFRWQEVFTGADSTMIGDDNLVRNKDFIRELYWDTTAELRRKRLMPFFWNVIAREGQLYGNRAYNNRVDMSNWYWISYPGYNELLTGYADPVPNPNLSINNKNENVLEYLNGLPNYKGKVVAFGSWRVFPYILNQRRSGIPVNSGYRDLEDVSDSTFRMIDRFQDEMSVKSHTRYDLLTFAAAREYISKNHPSVVFIGFGETDEAAHAGRYDLYLQDAAEVDRMIAALWYFVQTDPEYKDRTAFIITTDHGRGKDAASWHTHSLFTRGSGQTWLACLGPGIKPLGEIKQDGQIYGKQVAATVTRLLGEQLSTGKPVGAALTLLPASGTVQ